MKYLVAFIVFLLGLLFAIEPIQAQRCLPGQKGLEWSAGIADGKVHAFFAGTHLNSYTRKGSYWTGGFDFLEKLYEYKDIRIPLAQFTAEGGYYYSFLSTRNKSLFWLAGITGVLGYETVHWGEKLLFDGASIENENAFLYGFAAGSNLEVYLNDRIVWLISLKERVLFGSSVSKFHTLLGMGIRIVIN